MGDPTPDPTPMFKAIREHLRRSRADAFVIPDEAGGYVLAVGRSREEIAEMVATDHARMKPYRGKD